MTNTDMSGWAAVPHWVMRGDVLPTMAAKLTYIALLDHANEFGECYPSVPLLAREVCASENTVRAALRSIESAGLIERVQRRRDDGGSTSNLYRVLAFKRHATPLHEMKAPPARDEPTPLHEMKAPPARDEGEETTIEKKTTLTSGGFEKVRTLWPKKARLDAKTSDAYARAAADVGEQQLARAAERYVKATEPRFVRSLYGWLCDRACYAAGLADSDDRSESDLSNLLTDLGSELGSELGTSGFLAAQRAYWRPGLNRAEARSAVRAALGIS